MSSTELVAFADDVTVVVTGRTTWLLESVTNEALSKVSEWMTGAGLTPVCEEDGGGDVDHEERV